jgi:hypothetical protein
MRTFIATIRVVCFALLASAGKATCQDAEPVHGVIRGKVIDETGAPVKGILVFSVKTEVLGHYFEKHFKTDSAGAFTIQPVGAGTHRIYAKNEAMGYPPTDFGFYSEGRTTPTAKISTGSREAEVVVVVGPKCGVLYGTARDSVTGRLVQGGVRLFRPGQPDRYFESGFSGDYEILIPPNEPIMVEIQAPGYEVWGLDRSSEPELFSGIKLRPGERRELNAVVLPSPGK